MKIAVLLTILLVPFLSFAECVNLSHKFKLGESDVEFKQVDCGRIDRQISFEGQPVGEVDHQVIDGKWKTDVVDDEYESYTRQTRWSWNSQFDVLMYEYFIDTTDKKSGDKSVSTGTQIFSKANNGIKFRELSQFRIAKANGKIEVTQDQKREIRTSLN